MNPNLKIILLLGILAEGLIVLLAFLSSSSVAELFKLAARYSGRLSLVIFLLCFFIFAFHLKHLHNSELLKKALTLFAVLHVIHFGFLATNIYLNALPIEVERLVGGVLAYLMIIIAPFKFETIKFSLKLVYFYYVSFVMLMTYIARINGGFEGAEPFWFHYVAIGLIVGSTLFLSGIIFKSKQQRL